jgi:hypothetical protein
MAILGSGLLCSTCMQLLVSGKVQDGWAASTGADFEAMECRLIGLGWVQVAEIHQTQVSLLNVLLGTDSMNLLC